MKLSKKTLYIGLFSLLYSIVAFSSYFHATSFFSLANNVWMSNILAFAFEVGQAAVLFSLLTSKKDRSRIMPWVLMGMFTLVQVIGNVFSSYKYLMLNSVEDLRYFKEPIFIWTSLPDDQATVIVVYLVGALLPVSALLLTSMITNYLSDEEEAKEATAEELIAKAKELEPDLHVELLDGPPEGEGRSDEQEIKDLNTLLDNRDKEIEELKKQLVQNGKKFEDMGASKDEEQQNINEIKQDETEETEHTSDTNVEDSNRETEETIDDRNKQEETVTSDTEVIQQETKQEDTREGSSDGVQLSDTSEEAVDVKTDEEVAKEAIETKVDKPDKKSHFINL